MAIASVEIDVDAVSSAGKAITLLVTSVHR
jgi:hypothetical protein